MSRSAVGAAQEGDGLEHTDSKTCANSLAALKLTQKAGLAALEAVQIKSYVGHNTVNFYSAGHL